MASRMWISDERLGQYKTRGAAERAARRERRETGIVHRIQLTMTYRDLESLLCWTVVAGMPGIGDRFQG